MPKQFNPEPYLKPTTSPFARYLIIIREIKAVYFITAVAIGLLVLAIIVHSFGTLAIDVQTTILLQKARSHSLDTIMELVTRLGDIGVLIAVAVAAALFLLYIGKAKSAGIVCLSLLAYPINVAIKGGIERLRPTSTIVQIISPAGGFSFPSGHAMISMAVYGTVAYLLWVYLRATWRGFIVTTAAIIILLIGISRIYLGVHWLTDVIAGWLGGLLLLLLLVQLHKKLTASALN